MLSVSIPVFFWALGLLVAHHPMIITGLARIQGDTGDTRLINYILEHGYRWLMSKPGHESLWDPAFYYPVKNALAYSDTLLGVLPFYAIWRIVGIQPDTAFQLWWLTISSLNYLVVYFFIRRLFGLSPLASALGAFLFAFGGPRISQVGHQQLFAHFYIVIGIYALVRTFQINRASPGDKRPILWISLFFACLVAQIYAGFYFGWFFLFCLVIAFVWAIIIARYRAPLLSVLRNYATSIAALVLFSAAVMAPMIGHYLEAARSIGYPDSSQASLMNPRLYSWVYSGPFSWVYKWMFYVQPFKSLYMDQEHRLGLGLVTSFIVLYGLYQKRNDSLVRLFILVSLTIFLLVTTFPLDLSLWTYLREVIPGAKAIRAVARVGMLLLIPASLGFAFFIEAVQKKGFIWLTGGIVLVCMLEQGRTDPSFTKYPIRSHIESISEEIDFDCKAFLYAPYRPMDSAEIPLIVWNIKNSMDALWAQMETGIPTINGYGYIPSGWLFEEINTQTVEDKRRIRHVLFDWGKIWNLNAEKICLIEKPVDIGWSRGSLLYFLSEKYGFIQRVITHLDETGNPYVKRFWAITKRYLKSP